MKSLYYFTKYTPVLFGIVLTAHCFLLLRGIDIALLKEFFSFGWLLAVVFTILSYKLNLCIIHRLYIWYDFLLDLCIKAQRYEIFNTIHLDVNDARLGCLFLGVIFQLLLIRRLYGCKYRTKGIN